MKHTALAALLLGTAALAMPALAQDHRDDPRDDHHAEQRDDARDHRAAPGPAAAPARQLPPPRADWQHEGYRHDDFRGAGPRHELYRGGRLPASLRGRTYVVDDWRGHHLSAPPRGYHWVQAGSDYVLAAVATGVILDVLLSNQ